MNRKRADRQDKEVQGVEVVDRHADLIPSNNVS